MPAAGLGLIVAGGLWFLLWTRRWRWAGLAPAAAGIILTLTARQPDLLIAEDGKLVAMRTESGALALSNRTHDRFTQSVWMRRAGEGDVANNPPAALANAPEAGQCGKGICRFAIDGKVVAILSDERLTAERQIAACADATLIVTSFFLHTDCQAPLVIDKSVLSRDGAISVIFDEHGYQVSTVRGVTGDRPWSRAQPSP
jgi:competence protein ComEC